MKELGFLPFKSRDEFEVLKKFLSCEEFKDEYFEEEKELLQWRKNTVWVSLRFFEMWLKGLDSGTSMQ